MYFKHNPLHCWFALLVSITVILSGCQQEEQYTKIKVGFKPALAITKVTLAATSYIRLASKIEAQQSIDIASLQSGDLHKLHITEGIKVKQGQAVVEVYSPELAGNYAITQANLQQTRVTLATEQLRLCRHQKLYRLNPRYCSSALIYRLWLGDTMDSGVSFEDTQVSISTGVLSRL